MEKIKSWISDNKHYLTLGLTAIIGGIVAYMGYQKGAKDQCQAKNEAEISALNAKVENTIIKEKLADSKKDINEISKDVDDILDRK